MNIERPGDPQGPEGAIDRAWRSASNESPAPHVDATILASARTPVRRARAWQPYAAAAAVAGLAFALVQLLPVQESTRSLEAPVPESHMATSSPARQAPAITPAEKATAERDANEAQDAADIAPPAVGPAAPVSAESAAGSALPPAPQAPPATPVQPQALERAGLAGQSAPQPTTAAPMSPESWAHRITALHAANDLDGAAAELRAFRAAVPDADRYLPATLHEWAAGVE